MNDNQIDQVAPGSGERRVKDAASAERLFQSLWKNETLRQAEYAKVLGQLDGNKPFDQRALDELAQNWRCNENFLDAASTLDQVLVGYWRLVHDVPNLVSVEVHDQTARASQYAKIFERAFSRFIKDWGCDYVTNYLRLAYNHAALGKGVAFFEDERSPRWRAGKATDVVVGSRAPANIDKIDLMFVRDEITISELWDHVRTDKNAEYSENRGWNLAAVRALIKRYFEDNNTLGNHQQPIDFMRVQEELRDNSSLYSETCGPIGVVHMWCKDWDGKVTHSIFATGLKDGAQPEGFLFDDFGVEGRGEALSDAVALVLFDVGGVSGTLHSVKGFAQKNFGLASITNRLKSRMVDRTMLDAVNLLDTEAIREDQIEIQQMGPVNVFPKGVEQMQYYPSGNIIAEAIGLLEGQQAHNNARYREQGRQIEQTQTATQANILAGLQSQVDTANATLYLTQIGDQFFARQIARMRRAGNTDPDAKKFKDRCKAAGMPEDVFHLADITVKTGANPGTASSTLRAQVAESLIRMSGSRLVNDRWAFETYISNTIGSNAIHEALVPEDESSKDDRQKREAVQENAHMGDGVGMPVAKADLHEVHLEEHLGPAVQIVKVYEQTQQITPDQLLFLQLAVPHMQEHFQYLGADNFKVSSYKQLWPAFSELVSRFSKIENRLLAEATRAQQGGGMSPQAAQMQPQLA